jgi:hypothetical protein
MLISILLTNDSLEGFFKHFEMKCGRSLDIVYFIPNYLGIDTKLLIFILIIYHCMNRKRTTVFTGSPFPHLSFIMHSLPFSHLFSQQLWACWVV